MEYYNITEDNLQHVLLTMSEAFQCNPLHHVPIDEAVSMWKKTFDETAANCGDGEYSVSEDEFQTFLTNWGNLSCDRMLSKLVKEEKLDMLHDGEQFHFRVIDKA